LSVTDDVNAKTPWRKDAEKIDNRCCNRSPSDIRRPRVTREFVRRGLVSGIEASKCPSTTEQEQAVHKAQVLTYLRLTKLKLGLLLNFGQKLLRDGIERVVNDL